MPAEFRFGPLLWESRFISGAARSRLRSAVPCSAEAQAAADRLAGLGSRACCLRSPRSIRNPVDPQSDPPGAVVAVSARYLWGFNMARGHGGPRLIRWAARRRPIRRFTLPVAAGVRDARIADHGARSGARSRYLNPMGYSSRCELAETLDFLAKGARLRHDRELLSHYGILPLQRQHQWGSPAGIEPDARHGISPVLFSEYARSGTGNPSPATSAGSVQVGISWAQSHGRRAAGSPTASPSVDVRRPALRS
jgi:hypothetical protein